MNASDTLKVRKVSFFVEPKAVYFIPKQSPDLYQNIFGIGHMGGGGCGSPSNNITTVTWQNVSPAMNFGLSGGMSVRLNKYFSYELSIAYYHYNLKYRATKTETDISSGDQMITKFNWNYISNALFINNGLSFTYKNFILTNSVMIGLNIPTSSNYATYLPSLYIMSEHKIGYSLYKNRVVPYVGINVLNNFSNGTAVIPFASVRVNF
jgi:outer membrane receptor for ferrienterochelin and colicin